MKKPGDRITPAATLLLEDQLNRILDKGGRRKKNINVSKSAASPFGEFPTPRKPASVAYKEQFGSPAVSPRKSAPVTPRKIVSAEGRMELGAHNNYLRKGEGL